MNEACVFTLVGVGSFTKVADRYIKEQLKKNL